MKKITISLLLLLSIQCFSQEKKVDSDKKLNLNSKIETPTAVLEILKSEKKPDSNLKVDLSKKDEEKVPEDVQIISPRTPDSNLKTKMH